MFSCNLCTDAILMLCLVCIQYLRSVDRLLWSDMNACSGQMCKMDTQYLSLCYMSVRPCISDVTPTLCCNNNYILRK